MYMQRRKTCNLFVLLKKPLVNVAKAYTSDQPVSTCHFREQLFPGWWTFIFALVIGFALWFGGNYHAPVAHASDAIPLCPTGQEYDVGLCYPVCKAGFTGIGPVCWKACPDGYHDDGALCRKDAIITPKDSYGRGAGTPLGCGAGEQQDGGLCYPTCKDGYSGVGPVCWQNCPANYTDVGALCRFNGSTFAKNSHAAAQSCSDGYTNVAGICWQQCPAGYTDTGAFCEPSSFAKDSYVVFPAWSSCKDGYTNVAGVCWQQCPANYTDIGALCRFNGSTFAKNSFPATQTCEVGYTNVAGICWQQCPAGYTDTGAFCEPSTIAKDSYGRGAGTPLHTCGAGQEADGGLCYLTCKDGYSGVGPVCWQQCPAGFTDDGALCRKDAVIVPKESYGRGAGAVPNCDVNNLNCAGNFETMNTFRPKPWGYNFANWGKDKYDASTDLDPATLIRMFGANTVCQSGNTAQDCVLKTTAQKWRNEWLTIANGGHCYGLAASSQLFFAGLDNASTYQSGAAQTYDLDANAAVRNHITELFVTQGLSPADGSSAQSIGSDKKPSEILNLIRTQLKDKPNDPYVLSFFYGKLGHAVTPFAIQDRGNGIFWLHIYDNNWPTDDRYIVFDVNQETWLYGFGATNPAEPSGAWTGNAQTKSMSLRPTSAHKPANWACPFCNGQVNASSAQANPTVAFNLTGEGQLLVMNQQQQAAGWDFNQHQFVNTITGSEIVPVIGGLGHAQSPLIRLPALSSTVPYTIYASGDTLTHTVTSNLLMVGPGYTVGVDQLTLNPQQNLLMTIRPDGRQITFKADAAGVFTPTIYLATDQTANGSYLFDVGGVKLSAGKTVTVTLDLTKNQLNFQDSNQGADAYQMSLLRITPTGEQQTFKADNVTLPDGAKGGAMEFNNWDGHGAMDFTINDQPKQIDNQQTNEQPNGQPNQVFLPLVTK